MKVLRKAAGLIGAILVVAFGGALLLVTPIFGAMLGVAGVGLLVWQVRALWKSREDPYDLKKLWDAPVPIEGDAIEEPDESYLEADSLAYCHRCGHAVPDGYARCPGCGSPL
jgi:hypothetical protein